MRRAARIAPRLRYGIHPMQVYAIFSCRVGLIKKKNGGKTGRRKERGNGGEKKDKETHVSSSSSSSQENPVFRILSTNNDSIAIPLQRACTPPQRRCLFGQLSMRTQVELLSSSRAGTMTWWRGSRVKAQ